MGQQVEFPKIPNTKPGEYQSVIVGLLAHIDRDKPDFKELKRYMRSRSIFDKDTVDDLFDLVGIRADKNRGVMLTKPGKELLGIDDPVAWKQALFMRIAGRNEILVKYVFDGLAERLYSVNEMYRVITSYVYPGKVITLPSFKNWMAWVEATGLIKFIGIRWGPAPLAKSIEEYLLGIDVEDILEEEAEEDLDDLDDFDEFDDDGFPEPAAPEAETSSDDDDLEDRPPGGLPDFEDDFARHPGDAQAVRMATAPPMDPLTTYQARLTLRSVAEIQEVQKVLELDPDGAEMAERAASLDEAELAHNLEGVRGLQGTGTAPAPLGLESFGLDPADYKKRGAKEKKSFFLYRALVAATCAFRPSRTSGASTAPAHSAASRFEVLATSGVLSRHFLEGQSLDEIVTGLVAAGYASRVDVMAVLPFMALARQALQGQEEWVGKVEKRKGADGVWEAVYEQLHAGVFTIELIWLVRELAKAELWSAEGLAETGVVPTQDVTDVAYRLGMLSTPYLGSFAAALYASRALTGLSGHATGFETVFTYFGRQMGCAYDCPNRSGCSYFCREKLRR